MTGLEIAAVAGLILLVAILYSSVGHAGASGYLATMGLFSLAQGTMRPTALILNLLVSVIGTVQFARAGHFRWRGFWPFALTSIPLSFWGGRTSLADATYNLLVGAVLLFAAWRLIAVGRGNPTIATQPAPIPWGLLLGAAIGYLSGLTSVGGGIFLTPVLLLMNWADPKQAAATSVAFILVNSAAGLAGQMSSTNGFKMPETNLLIAWGAAAIIGGAIGSTLGSRHFPALILRRLLAVVLVIAGIKLLSEGASSRRPQNEKKAAVTRLFLRDTAADSFESQLSS
jgi:uncharacterized membrane protein YfcA